MDEQKTKCLFCERLESKLCARFLLNPTKERDRMELKWTIESGKSLDK